MALGALFIFRLQSHLRSYIGIHCEAIRLMMPAAREAIDMSVSSMTCAVTPHPGISDRFPRIYFPFLGAWTG
jgi:hypothetical protein